MRVRRITISVPTETARRIKRAAAGTSISAWVTGVIEDRLDDAELERLWEEFYRTVHPGRGDVKRADALFRRLTKPRRRRQSAA